MTRALQTVSLLLLASSYFHAALQQDVAMNPTALSAVLRQFLILQVYLLLVLPLLNDHLESVSGYGVSALRSTKIPSFLPHNIQVEVIPVLPFWVLVTLGAYMLGRLGLGVMRFKGCESAYTELTGHIEKAKQDLDARHVSWS